MYYMYYILLLLYCVKLFKKINVVVVMVEFLSTVSIQCCAKRPRLTVANDNDYTPRVMLSVCWPRE